MPDGLEECLICHKAHCDFHHLLTNGRKRFAETAGAWVWLCRGHHNYIHNTAEGQRLWKEWKAQAQRNYEADHTHDEWMKGAHKSYI